ncbi:MAG: MerR family transcriptional regulator, thiopeptide resistance regulator [Frankiaceae bacterium]|jgi:DNA-binding transcriptional MerR regulator|nr:MerR family transcriptional regulator, thiopeptide resistance regulator [Frankiaceae bacterium]
MRVGELAEATGLTVRTLHHYDALGLVTPSGRTGGGHREYAAADVRRLYQVVALRRLGFALHDVKALLDGAAYDPRETVRRHLAESARRVAAETELRQRLTHLLAVLDRGGEPTTEDLLRAVEATTMSETYYTPEQRAELERRRTELGDDAMARAQQDWVDLYAALKVELDAGTDPADSRVQALAAKARELLAAFTGGDPAMYASLKRMYDAEGPETASRGVADAATQEYLQRAIQVARG